MKLFQKIELIILIILIAITTVGGSIYQWYKNTFGVSIVEILYTIQAPLKGADTDFLSTGFAAMLPSVAVFLFLTTCIVMWMRAERWLTFELSISVARWNRRISARSVVCKLLMIFFAIRCCILFINVDDTLKIRDYVNRIKNVTTLYEDHYILPESENIRIVTEDNPRNLILIYLESMETTYASMDEGGSQSTNYIPHLTQLAKDNISFSDDELLGGFHSTVGTGWTMAALFATETGIPFSFPMAYENEDYGEREAFASGTTSLGDILDRKGYYQEFLCGSDATFAGRRAFFEQHGDYNIFDWNSAIEAGYVSEEDKVWWGLEDKNLYRIAKDELDRMARLDKPFNLTMLTVDTHHVDGWVCDLCENKYPDRLANVVECADKQIFDFVEWCKEQPWFDDTVIVIMGDHPRMDTSLVADTEYYDRTVYNCFINSCFDAKKISTVNREFTSMDMFPTVLASLGYQIEGERLGLGTNLFSTKATFAEEWGYDYFNSEIGKYSAYYIKRFS